MQNCEKIKEYEKQNAESAVLEDGTSTAEKSFLKSMINKELITDKASAIYGATIDGRSLAFMSEELQNDKDVVEKALENEKTAWVYVGDRLKSDKVFIMDLL